MPIDPRRIEVIDDRTADVLRRMTPQQRVRRGLALGEFARSVIAARVRTDHPHWSETQVKQEAARRFGGG